MAIPGDSVVMLSDANDEWKPMQMNINLAVEDCDAMYKSAMGAGGKSLRRITTIRRWTGPASRRWGDA